MLQALHSDLRPRDGLGQYHSIPAAPHLRLPSQKLLLTWPFEQAAWEGLQQDGPCERPVTCQYRASKIDSQRAANPLIQCVPTAGRCGDNCDLPGLGL